MDTPMTACALCGASDIAMLTPMPSRDFPVELGLVDVRPRWRQGLISPKTKDGTMQDRAASLQQVGKRNCEKECVV
jgi:hypothetical protein